MNFKQASESICNLPPRRELIQRAGLVTLAAVGASLNLSAKSSDVFVSKAPNLGNSFAGNHKPKELGFNPKVLKGISEKLILSHWENNYQGSVKALNGIETKIAGLLKEKDVPAFVYGGLKREQQMRTGSIVLHEHYFQNLGGDGKPAGQILKTLESSFGSFDVWADDVKRTAMALAGGTGWVVLSYNWHTHQLENYWLLDHTNQPPGSIPLLVLDMYEHSYQMDYGSAAAKYVDVFFTNINWEVVDKRYMRAQKFDDSI